MGILDKIVEWIAEQVMNLLDMISTSVLGALGCNMDSFLRYFPAAETMYSVFVALAIGLILLNWVWNVFKNFGLVAGLEAEDPIKLSIRSVLFIFLAFCKYRSRYPTYTAFCSHRAGLSAPLSRNGAPLLHINPRRSFSTAIAACRREPVGKSGGGCRLYVSGNSVSFILGELQSHST